MKLIKIFLITFLLTSACLQNDNQQDEFKNSSLNASQDVNPPDTGNQGSNSQHKDTQGIFHYTFTGNEYDITCVDNVLGINRANEIFDEDKAMTNQEIARVSHCVVDQKTESVNSSSGGNQNGNLPNRKKYDISCVDNVLGINRANEIFHEGKPIRNQEIARISQCVVDQKTESIKNEKEIQFDNRRIESAWIPSPKDALCANRMIGIEAFRAIYNGERLATEKENEAWRECIPNLSIYEITHPLAKIECPDLQQMWKARHEFVPRWDQIECHTGSLERYNLPEFRAHDNFPVSGSDSNANQIWPFSIEELLNLLDAKDWQQFDRSQYTGRDQDLWRIMELLEENLSGNWSFMPMAHFPPYQDDFGNLMQYPPNDYWHDQSLRVYALHAIQRKINGHLIVMMDFYPPEMLAAPATNSTQFRKWIDEIFIPQKIHEAKIAELLKAEIFFPFPIEIERWIQAQPWADATTTEEKIYTAQYALNNIHQAVRPIFSGKLDVWSYANYLPDRDGSAWKNLVFSDYDEVSFHLFPECDLEFSVMYTQNQMKYIMEIVNRDNLTWWIGEWDLKKKSFEQLCETNMQQNAAKIMEAMLDIIFAQQVQPIGIDYRGIVYSSDQLGIIEDRIFRK